MHERGQRTLAEQVPYCSSGGPLHPLIDSTGIKVCGEREWHARKHGGARRRVWRKVHLAIDEATLEVRSRSPAAAWAPLSRLLRNRLPGNGCARVA